MTNTSECQAKNEYTLTKAEYTTVVVRQYELWCYAAGRPGVIGKVMEVIRVGSTGMKRCEEDYLALEIITKGVGAEHREKFGEAAL